MPNPVNLPNFSYISGPSALPQLPVAPPKKSAEEHLAIGDGFFRKKDFANAVGHYRLAIDHPEAKVKLGNCYIQGLFFEKSMANRAIGLKLFEEAVQQGSVLAMGCLGCEYVIGNSTAEEIERGYQLLLKAQPTAPMGLADYGLSIYYQKTANDKAKSLSYLISGAQKKNANCIQQLIKYTDELLKMYAIPPGTTANVIQILCDLGIFLASSKEPVNMKRAVYLRNRAKVVVFSNVIKCHYKQNQNYKAVHLRNRAKVVAFSKPIKSHIKQYQDYKKEERYCRLSLSLGNTKALRYLGVLLFTGKTGKQDIKNGLAMMATDPGFMLEMKGENFNFPRGISTAERMHIRRARAEYTALFNASEVVRQGQYGMAKNPIKAIQLSKECYPPLQKLVESLNRNQMTDGLSELLLPAASAAVPMDTRDDEVEESHQRKRKNDENIDPDPTKLKKLAREAY